jgi:hypothetical protein
VSFKKHQSSSSEEFELEFELPFELEFELPFELLLDEELELEFEDEFELELEDEFEDEFELLFEDEFELEFELLFEDEFEDEFELELSIDLFFWPCFALNATVTKSALTTGFFVPAPAIRSGLIAAKDGITSDPAATAVAARKVVSFFI